MSQSVKQCINVDLFPIFWPMLLTFRRWTFCCIHHCWTKHPGYPLRECLLDFINCCLYIVCMYQWQNQHALPLVPGWILVPSDPWRWHEKLLCSVVRALISTLRAALHGHLMLAQCVIASHAEVWTCQYWWKFYQVLTVTMVQVPEGTAVSTQGQHNAQ